MNKLLLASLLACLSVGAPRADTAAPPLVNYQGTLTDENGAAIPDGTKKLEFNLYDAPLAGNRVWGPQVFDNVPVVNGRFDLILGSEDQAGRSISNAFSGSQRYLGFKVGATGADLSAVPEIAPRQQVLSSPFAISAMYADNGVPSGTVVAWYGIISNIPAGWVLCDGTNGTPDLRGRFLVGAGSDYQIGDMGGESRHTLTTAEMPSHTHTYGLAVEGGRYDGHSSIVYNQTVTNATGATGGSQPHENRPPYFALAYIMRR